MQGFRTILVAIFGPFVLWVAKVLAVKGFNLTPDQEQTLTEYLVGGGMTVAMIVMRFLTSTPVFKKVVTEFESVSTPTAPASTTITSQSPGATTVKMLPVLLIGAALTILGFTMLTGCATIAKLSTPTYAPFVQVAVDAAVAGAVGNNPANQKTNAAKIKLIAQEVLAADSGTTATLDAIEAVVNAKVAALKLPPADVAAAQLLTATLAAVIQTQLSSNAAAGAITAATQVAIAAILNDVITATSAYGA